MWMPLWQYFTNDSTTTRSTSFPRIPSVQPFTRQFLSTTDNGSSLLSICTPTCLQWPMWHPSNRQSPCTKTPILQRVMHTLVREACCLRLSYMTAANPLLLHDSSHLFILRMPSWTVTHCANPIRFVLYRLLITHHTNTHETWPPWEVRNDNADVAWALKMQFLM